MRDPKFFQASPGSACPSNQGILLFEVVNLVKHFCARQQPKEKVTPMQPAAEFRLIRYFLLPAAAEAAEEIQGKSKQNKN